MTPLAPGPVRFSNCTSAVHAFDVPVPLYAGVEIDVEVVEMVAVVDNP
jgi:hypothetical protein